MDEGCSVTRDLNASFTSIMSSVEQKRRQISNRSTAVPMDFEFTNRPTSNTKPAWVADDPFHSPQKRMPHRLSPLRLIPSFFVTTGSYDEANPPQPPIPLQNAASEQLFRPESEPHLFSTPGPHTPSRPQWQPPPLPHVKNPDIVDVDMSEVSPNVSKTQQQLQHASPSKPEKESRVVALGDIRRVLRSRHGKAALQKRDADPGDADEESVNSGEEEESDHESLVINTAKRTITNNRYTLNLAPSALATEADLPRTLSGLAFPSNIFERC